MSFLKQTHIENVNVDPVDRYETPEDELWTPYPLQNQPRKSYMSLYFDEACKLSYIARDVSWDVSHPHKDVKPKQEMFTRLLQWEKELPRFFDSVKEAAPYISMLRFVLPCLVPF